MAKAAVKCDIALLDFQKEHQKGAVCSTLYMP